MNSEPTATKVLVVDPEEPVRLAHARQLRRLSCWCALASDATEARKRLEEQEFDLALIEVNMPGVCGMDLVRYLRSEHPNTATLIVTAVNNPLVADAALQIGAHGYLLKPFEPNELLINVSNALRRRKLEMENRAHKEQLEQLVAERTQALHEAMERLKQTEHQVRLSQEDTIVRLARAAEFRDDEPGGHVHRMSRYCTLIAQRLGHDAERCELIRVASIMHDVGKIGIPDEILLKRGPLTPEEFEFMKRHADFGYDILAGSAADLLQMAATIAWTHHERYDGTGYPQGLAGEAIPLEGRIAAIADVFDALTTKLVYKPAFPLEKALAILREERGKHFDPSLLDLFIKSIDDVLRIREQYQA